LLLTAASAASRRAGAAPRPRVLRRFQARAPRGRSPAPSAAPPTPTLEQTRGQRLRPHQPVKRRQPRCTCQAPERPWRATKGRARGKRLSRTTRNRQTTPAHGLAQTPRRGLRRRRPPSLAPLHARRAPHLQPTSRRASRAGAAKARPKRPCGTRARQPPQRARRPEPAAPPCPRCLCGEAAAPRAPPPNLGGGAAAPATAASADARRGGRPAQTLRSSPRRQRRPPRPEGEPSPLRHHHHHHHHHQPAATSASCLRAHNATPAPREPARGTALSTARSAQRARPTPDAAAQPAKRPSSARASVPSSRCSRKGLRASAHPRGWHSRECLQQRRQRRCG